MQITPPGFTRQEFTASAPTTGLSPETNQAPQGGQPQPQYGVPATQQAPSAGQLVSGGSAAPSVPPAAQQPQGYPMPGPNPVVSGGPYQVASGQQLPVTQPQGQVITQQPVAPQVPQQAAQPVQGVYPTQGGPVQQGYPQQESQSYYQPPQQAQPQQAQPQQGVHPSLITQGGVNLPVLPQNLSVQQGEAAIQKAEQKARSARYSIIPEVRLFVPRGKEYSEVHVIRFQQVSPVCTVLSHFVNNKLVACLNQATQENMCPLCECGRNCSISYIYNVLHYGKAVDAGVPQSDGVPSKVIALPTKAHRAVKALAEGIPGVPRPPLTDQIFRVFRKREGRGSPYNFAQDFVAPMNQAELSVPLRITPETANNALYLFYIATREEMLSLMNREVAGGQAQPR